jgi:hypothetical protein
MSVGGWVYLLWEVDIITVFLPGLKLVRLLRLPMLD